MQANATERAFLEIRVGDLQAQVLQAKPPVSAASATSCKACGGHESAAATTDSLPKGDTVGSISTERWRWQRF